MNLSTHSTLHKRMKCFLDYITPKLKTKPNGVDTIEQQIIQKSKEVRDRVIDKAKEDGLVVMSTPNSGSYAKNTGLARKRRGKDKVYGFDVDMPIVLKDEDMDGNLLDDLLTKFYTYVQDSYPKDKYPNYVITKTKSSIELETSQEYYFDIVPMLATDKPDEQVLIRRDGERIKTSIQKHITFVKRRTNESNQECGVVKFNECVRLMKWWKEIYAQRDEDYYYLLGDDNKPASLMIELLCAWAFKECGVAKTYAETLSKWCGFLANQAKNKVDIIFTDNYTIDSVNQDSKNVLWTILDPVASDNNIIKKWGKNELNEFCTWLNLARDTWARAIRYDKEGYDSKSMDELVVLFGNHFRNNSGK